MRQKAEQLLQLRGLTGGNSSSKKQNSTRQELSEFPDFADKLNRRDSLGSSSGFVSLGSGQLGVLVNFFFKEKIFFNLRLLE